MKSPPPSFWFSVNKLQIYRELLYKATYYFPFSTNKEEWNLENKFLLLCILSRKKIILDISSYLFIKPFTFIVSINSHSQTLTVSWWGSLSYRNQSIDLHCKSMDWFLHDRDLRHEWVKPEIRAPTRLETVKGNAGARQNPVFLCTLP